MVAAAKSRGRGWQNIVSLYRRRSKLTFYLEIDDKVLEVRIFDDSLLANNILNSFTQVAPLIVTSKISEISPHSQLSAKDKLG